MPDILQLEGVTKTYGRTPVLNDVNLRLAQGQCLALLGENGAGKSTLIKIVGGITRQTSGNLVIQGQRRVFHSPIDSQRAGVAVVPQDLAYVPHITVAENLVIGRWPQRLGFTDQHSIMRQAETEASALSGIGINLNLRATMADVSLAERQLVEIAKAMSIGAELLLFDEPTAVLSAVEADRLLAILEELKRAGRSLVYVTHHVDEAFRLANQVAVLRNGHLVFDQPRAAAAPDAVITAMLGEAAEQAAEPVSDEQRRPPDTAQHEGRDAKQSAVLALRNWHIQGLPGLKDVSFQVFAGEIVGVFGLVGSGAELVAKGLVGQVKVDGQIELEGHSRAPFGNPVQARDAGFSYVPAERKVDGLALSQSIKDNIVVQVLSRLSSFGVIRTRAERAEASRLAGQHDVRYADIGQSVGELSGGNQQKVLIASRLAANPKVLVLHEPTRGVDIGARAQIHRLLIQIARAGTPIVLVTSDSAEAVAVSDRLLVMRNGQIIAELSGASKTEDEALAVATRASDSQTTAALVPGATHG